MDPPPPSRKMVVQDNRRRAPAGRVLRPPGAAGVAPPRRRAAVPPCRPCRRAAAPPLAPCRRGAVPPCRREMIRRITTIDAHAAGEPLRLVVGGIPAPPGATMLDKRASLRRRRDRLRRAPDARAPGPRRHVRGAADGAGEPRLRRRHPLHAQRGLQLDVRARHHRRRDDRPRARPSRALRSGRRRRPRHAGRSGPGPPAPAARRLRLQEALPSSGQRRRRSDARAARRAGLVRERPVLRAAGWPAGHPRRPDLPGGRGVRGRLLRHRRRRGGRRAAPCRAPGGPAGRSAWRIKRAVERIGRRRAPGRAPAPRHLRDDLHGAARARGGRPAQRHDLPPTRRSTGRRAAPAPRP